MVHTNNLTDETVQESLVEPRVLQVNIRSQTTDETDINIQTAKTF